ncbi:MAG: calcium/sodium antiporter [Alphaproteobacteria bacterium]
MVSFETLLLLAGGLAVLTAGAEFLVRGASRLAAIAGISPLVIGLTVVAYGTSSPEMAVSVGSAYSGQADIALGNVVGSNIFNVLFSLGLCALILPLRVAQQLIWLDVPIMIGTSCLAIIMGLDGKLSRIDGVILFAGAVLYTIFAIKEGRKENAAVEKEYGDEFGTKDQPSYWPMQAILIIAGLAMLVLGARWLVDGAVAIAKLLGVSELVIGLTVIAAGTSLPEVATSVVASIRCERDIAVGNVVGSNIFNILAALGLSSIAAPDGIAVAPAALSFDIPVMIAVALACAPIFFTGHLIARWEGGLFVLYYAAYAAYLILNARAHDALPAFSALMLEFVLPLTLLTLVIGYVRYAAKPDRRLA